MKITVLAQAYLFDGSMTVNGTLVQLHNLAYGFKESGLEVHYIASTKDRTKITKDVIKGIHFYWIHEPTGWLSWKLKMALYMDVLTIIKPDAIYVRGRHVLQYVAGKYAGRYNIPYVWGTNGDDSAEFWKNVKRLKKSNKKMYKKLFLLPVKAYEDYFINKGMKMADTVINQSIHQQKETKRILKKEGVILPSYFINTNIEGENKKKNQVLWLANLSPNKQPEVFVKLIKACSLNTWEVVLGGGTSDKNYENKISGLTNGLPIKTTGKINFKDSFAYYKSSKIYINTSIPEADGLPNAYIQSWLIGTVVLSLNHDPNHWMETYNIGFCAHGDFEALKLKLQQLIKAPKLLETMSDNAIKFAAKTFSNPIIIDKYIELFKNPI